MWYIGLQIHPQLLLPSHNKCGFYLTESTCNRIIFQNKREEKDWSISSIQNVRKNFLHEYDSAKHREIIKQNFPL